MCLQVDCVFPCYFLGCGPPTAPTPPHPSLPLLQIQYSVMAIYKPPHEKIKTVTTNVTAAASKDKQTVRSVQTMPTDIVASS